MTKTIWIPDGYLELTPGKVERYEARWREIKEKYSSVHLHLHLNVGILGEMLYRWFAMCEEPREEGALYVQVPAETPRRNDRAMANIFANEYVGICGEDDREFWTYVLKSYQGDLVGDVARFASRNGFPAYFKKAYSIEHHFTDEQVERGEAALKAMGVTGPFVCLAARSRYYNMRKGEMSEYCFRHRNMEFEDYAKTIAWLGGQGIQCVKMGRGEDPMDPIPNCIDYAAYHASDFMDLYVFSRCEFAVTCLSGITTLANLFAKPLLMVNTTEFSFGLGAARYTEHDRFLPKRYYIRDIDRRRVKRPLTLREIFETEKTCDHMDAHLIERSIEWSDDTEDEILDAVKEMVSRIDGTWTDTEEDEELLDRWWALHDEMEAFQGANEYNWIGGPVPFPPATTFLRKHPYVLGMDR